MYFGTIFACAFLLGCQIQRIRSFSELNNIKKIISDFILTLKTPTSVSSKVCWSRRDKILFSQHLNKYLIRSRYVNAFHDRGNGVPEFVQLFLLDLRCDGYVRFLQEGNDQHLFAHPYRWIVLVNDMKDIPKNLSILVDSQFYVAKNMFPNTYTIHALYKITSSDNFLINYVAIWTSDLGFNYFHRLNIASNRKNLRKNNFTLSMVITNEDSLNHLWDYRDRHVDATSKLNFLLCHYVMDFLNASHDFIIRSTWGYRNQSTNKYDGMIGDLQSGLVEFAGSPVILIADRLSVLDYIAPTTPTRCSFIFRAPSLSHVTNILTSPFDTTVWYCCFLLVMIIAVVVYIIVVWEWKYRDQHVLSNTQYALRPKFVDVLVMELGAICQQGSEAEPRSTSGRIATIFIFVAVLFMYTFYSANIVALLQSTSESIQTIDDLLTSRIKLGAEDIPYSKFFFKIQAEPTRKAIYEQKIINEGHKPNFFDSETGIEKVKKEFFAFHIENAIGYKLIADTFEEGEKCRLREILYITELTDPWMPIKKNSSYKEVAKIAFRRLRENGMQSREFRKIYYDKKPVCESKSSSVTNVGLIECYYAFLIFIIGCLLAVLLLLLEMVTGKNRNNLAMK